MRNQDAVEPAYIFSDRVKPLGDFAAAQTGIDQQARAIGSDKSSIARTAGGENANLQDAY